MRLSDFELDVLTRFWDHERLSAPELFRGMGESRGVTYSTIKTIVDRLEDKGAIRRVDTAGKTIIYSASVSRERVRQPLVDSFVKRMFGEDRRPLFAQLLRDEKLSDDEMDFLRQLVGEAEQDRS
jgi:BlaI family transcriptional regulator, penicillinase repressor